MRVLDQERAAIRPGDLHDDHAGLQLPAAALPTHTAGQRAGHNRLDARPVQLEAHPPLGELDLDQVLRPRRGRSQRHLGNAAGGWPWL